MTHNLLLVSSSLQGKGVSTPTATLESRCSSSVFREGTKLYSILFYSYPILTPAQSPAILKANGCQGRCSVFVPHFSFLDPRAPSYLFPVLGFSVPGRSERAHVAETRTQRPK